MGFSNGARIAKCSFLGAGVFGEVIEVLNAHVARRMNGILVRDIIQNFPSGCSG